MTPGLTSDDLSPAQKLRAQEQRGGGIGDGAGPRPMPPSPVGRHMRCHSAGVSIGLQAPCAWWDCRHWYRTPSWVTVAPTG
ncbi:hypothetical protein SSP24_64770 [Streptomyces spinoverrucosus]|uniref:Uncharacterized protein n=1 Tax=Streptomyces spinoverrucosus TaxID=284043 RepID=A0A4Y3VP91_9ACTN|nr:hypothetical protein SSP24_64770 [Streptomyces spinoverrucosus]GHB88688.1 hypothetical protein GCM10010397_70720 [Streptomyces spinoverrucosus]